MRKKHKLRRKYIYIYPLVMRLQQYCVKWKGKTAVNENNNTNNNHITV